MTKYVRYAHDGDESYGVLEGDIVRELDGDLFADPRPTGRSVPLARVELLVPVQPQKVIAVGLNYRSHLGERDAAAEPGLFAKFPSSLVATGQDIVLPEGSTNVHYEGELVVVIGKRARDVPVGMAAAHIFGITAGNDVSERAWQRNDLQWFRAKGSDTFGPVGPAIATGVDYADVQVQTRLNGEVRQSERTDHMIFTVDEIVSYVSRFVTLEPGDLIFTGTPGQTEAMKPGDVVEVEVEGVGVLRNTVRAAKAG